MRKPTYKNTALIALFFLLSLTGIAQTYQPWAVRENNVGIDVEIKHFYQMILAVHIHDERDGQ